MNSLAEKQAHVMIFLTCGRKNRQQTVTETFFQGQTKISIIRYEQGAIRKSS